MVNENTTINYCYLIKVNPKPIIDMAQCDGQWVYASRLTNNSIGLSKEAVPLDLTVLYYDIENSKYYIYNGTTLEGLSGNTVDYCFYLNDNKYSLL
jgi:hypothetical protein